MVRAWSTVKIPVGLAAAIDQFIENEGEKHGIYSRSALVSRLLSKFLQDNGYL